MDHATGWMGRCHDLTLLDLTFYLRMAVDPKLHKLKDANTSHVSYDMILFRSARDIIIVLISCFLFRATLSN